MSTLAEHVAAIEFYRANYEERQTIRQALDMELWLLATAHLKEVAAMCQPNGLHEAREAFARTLRSSHGEAAEPFIARWEAMTNAARPVAQPANTDSVPGSPLGSGARPDQPKLPESGGIGGSSIGLGAEGEQ